jgi:hypothetical protein
MTHQDPYDWHVASVLVWPVTHDRAMVHHVQRYRRPEEGRETGEVLCQSFISRDDAEAVAARLNAEPTRPRDSRTAYL